jgi:RimJ/RimL family protein N-acetyltransferase
LSDLTIRPLTAADAADLSVLLTRDQADYRQHFQAFDASAESLSRILGSARRDRYWGLRFESTLVGLMMLRGFDEGYEAPSFGVYIAQPWSRKGLGRLALTYAETWCRLSGCSELMLSVHADNGHARREYERAGFRATGEQTSRGHDIMRKRLPAR